MNPALSWPLLFPDCKGRVADVYIVCPWYSKLLSVSQPVSVNTRIPIPREEPHVMDQELSCGGVDGPAPQCSQPLPRGPLMPSVPVVQCVAKSVNGSVADELVSLDSCLVVGHLEFLVPFEQKGNGANLRHFSDLSSPEETLLGRCCCIFKIGLGRRGGSGWHGSRVVLCQELLLSSSRADQVCVDRSSHLQDWNHV